MVRLCNRLTIRAQWKRRWGHRTSAYWWIRPDCAVTVVAVGSGVPCGPVPASSDAEQEALSSTRDGQVASSAVGQGSSLSICRRQSVVEHLN